MSLISISDPKREFGQNERVIFEIIKETDGFKAIAQNDDFEIKTSTLKELKQWLCFNIPNYRSNEHEFERI